ncbi:MAG: antitoxin family protein [Candidatus Scalindua sp.]
MTKTINAIYENGVFKPIEPVGISEHKKVTLIIEEEQQVHRDIIGLAANVYRNLSPQSIEDVEQLATDRSHFTRNSSS